jgi:hypothetical protein
MAAYASMIAIMPSHALYLVLLLVRIAAPCANTRQYLLRLISTPSQPGEQAGTRAVDGVAIKPPHQHTL